MRETLIEAVLFGLLVASPIILDAIITTAKYVWRELHL